MSSGEKKDYVFVLKALKELPFGVGRNLLIDHLQGIEENESVRKHKFFDLQSFGSLAYGKGELNSMIGNLLMKGFIELSPIPNIKFGKVLKLTKKGELELAGQADGKETKNENTADNSENIEDPDDNLLHSKTVITDADRLLFLEFDFFLSNYNDEQKKAVISISPHVLCVAGAGSGKTTVLTKRIEFLVKFCSVKPEKILAITFTRKARQEMMRRLSTSGFSGEVFVETFNSFCEKTLKKHTDLVYGRQVNVLNYHDKIKIIKNALSKLGLSMEYAIKKYFNGREQKGKTDEQLMNIFMNDCFFIRDYLKFKNRSLDDFLCDADAKCYESVVLVKKICAYIEEYLVSHGLRDYADQLLDTLKLFKEHSETLPQFEHILIDEYQDVNSTQIELINLLNAPKLFCVGDPRQSIYGWRGSDVSYILEFEKTYPDCEIIHLTKNYRSTSYIVELINQSIKHMGLPDLEAWQKGEKDLRLLSFASEEAEHEFVIQRILSSEIPRNEIFVLARTNKQLSELSDLMRQRGMKHVLRGDEGEQSIFTMEDDVTLATVHAIKGMEAEMVFLIGCTTANFPCRGSEHPVVDMVKVDEYDKDEEEKRLFYVATSRAKQSLYLSYAGKSFTSFLTRDIIKLIDPEHEALKQRSLFEYSQSSAKNIFAKANASTITARKSSDSSKVASRLIDWRRKTSDELGVAPFMIMHDKTLYEIAEKLPLQADELREIHGMGPAKMRRFGKEILELVY
jgi:superfamily I DNA/RNA helicase